MKHRYSTLWMGWLVAATLGAVAAEPAASGSATNRSGNGQVASTSRRSALEVVGTADDLILLERSTRALEPMQAGPDEGNIAQFTARVLATQHYDRRPLDDVMSAKFLDRYLQYLDSQRLHFLESDIRDFEKYRHELDDLTRAGDTSPAREIFERYVRRMEQRVGYVGQLLKTETFDFTGNDRFQLDRAKAPWPKDLEAAQALWRQFLRNEVLLERLNYAAKARKPTSNTNPPPASTVLGPNGLSEDIVKTITRRYARVLWAFHDFDHADVFQYYLTSLTRSYDPHSDYMGPATLENFAINMNLSLFGIGAVLQSEDGYCKVRELRPGPAMRSKLIKPGDRIVEVAQGDGEPVDVVDMKLPKVVELIRGPKGTTVKLTIIPVDATDPSERKVVALMRDEIKLEDEEAKAKVFDLPAPDGRTNRLGLIDLPSFYANVDLGMRNGRSRAKSTTVDVARLLKKLKDEGVQGVILDLRRNGGGALEEAIDLTGLFIKQGPVVQVKDALGRVLVDEDPNTFVAYEGPLLVLTSRYSASASEIVAGALQDYGRALIVGDSSTHGKGTVQSLIQLQPLLERRLRQLTNDPGGVKLTIRKFYRASGGSTQLKGVIPDLILPSVNNLTDVGEAALDDPMPWDEIEPAEFEPENRIAPLLAELRRRSDQRISADKDYDYMRDDMARYQARMADKSVSLNEAERLRERQENEDRLEARKRERETRRDPVERVYELTLAATDLPGLPPPAASTNTPAAATTAAADSGATPSDDEAEEDRTPPVDVGLKEARRILIDLIELSGPKTGLAVKPAVR